MSPTFWEAHRWKLHLRSRKEVLAKSTELRRHALRIFRENESWLPVLEVPCLGHRVGSYFRRGAFEPIVGAKGVRGFRLLDLAQVRRACLTWMPGTLSVLILASWRGSGDLPALSRDA